MSTFALRYRNKEYLDYLIQNKISITSHHKELLGKIKIAIKIKIKPTNDKTKIIYIYSKECSQSKQK